jgi:hypothetical protein
MAGSVRARAQRGFTLLVMGWTGVRLGSIQ